jgi:hypothetical protein
MNCNEFYAVAADWLEGARSAPARAHLEACPRCRGFVAELEAISSAALELEQATPAPPERVWAGLRAQLQAEGLIRETREAAAEPVRMADLLAGLFRRPAFAGTFAVIFALAVVLAGLPGGPPTEDQIALVHPVAAPQVQTSVQADARNPAVAATYKQSMELVDRFIAMCEKTVREQPENTVAREYLYSAYQQKADLLATLVERSTGD